MASSVQPSDVVKSVKAIAVATLVTAPLLVVCGACGRVLWEVTKFGWTLMGFLP